MRNRNNSPPPLGMECLFFRALTSLHIYLLILLSVLWHLRAKQHPTLRSFISCVDKNNSVRNMRKCVRILTASRECDDDIETKNMTLKLRLKCDYKYVIEMRLLKCD